MPRAKHTRPAFSLIELLIVMIIIAVVIAIVLPALGGARNAAKRTSTSAMLNSLQNAIVQFESDNRRLPGYFDARDMGSQENADTRGMSAVENMLLDLSGGIVSTSDSETIDVGPTAADTVIVKPSLIGAKGAGKAYFTPEAKFLAEQTNDGASVKQFGVPGHTDQSGQVQLPDLVDAFGSPILVWAQDVAPTGNAPNLQDARDEFAIEKSSSAQDVSAFYWGSNAAFLRSNSLGKIARDQTTSSAIGFGAADRVESLIGVLGHPSFPARNTNEVPGAARGRYVLHSAGQDGVYFGLADKGMKQFDADTILYKRNIMNASDERYKDDQGRMTTINILDAFDDIVISGGN